MESRDPVASVLPAGFFPFCSMQINACFDGLRISCVLNTFNSYGCIKLNNRSHYLKVVRENVFVWAEQLMSMKTFALVVPLRLGMIPNLNKRGIGNKTKKT